MSRHTLISALRYALLSALVIPLVGCFCGDESLHYDDYYYEDTSTTASLCDTGTFTPERIELLDMSDRSVIEDGGSLHIAFGGQGSEMVGVYVAVYGDDIPDCLRTQVSLEGFGNDVDDWELVDDGLGRAETIAPIYFVTDGAGPGASTIAVTIGGLTIEQDVTIDY